MKPKIAVLSAPSNLGLMPPAPGQEPGVRRMAAALKELGLLAQLGPGAYDAGEVAAPPYRPQRDPQTRVRNSAAVRDYALRLAAALEPLLAQGAFPLLLGGDCSILLGSMLALRRRGQFGLVFIDGHRDFQTPQTSGTGGAAGMDLALVTGRGPQTLARLDGFERLVADEAVVVLGTRDAAPPELDGGRAIYETAITLLDLDDVRQNGPSGAAQRALAVLDVAAVEGFWIHLDVDVLDGELMPAVDSPQPGGLTYEELAALLAPLLTGHGVQGMQLTIYDPDLDPDGEVGWQLVDWLASLPLPVRRPGNHPRRPVI